MLPYSNSPEEAPVADAKDKVEKPPLYKVILHNDDYTTMEFVVYVLQAIFHRSEADAFRLMMQVHIQGKGIAGIYTLEVAEMKVAETMELARLNEYPLLCTLERAD
jgi:ATP-dependent Clp protease adaptor protein ClpS